MATVRDPNFWKRFSAAVHQDDQLKEEANRSGLKQTYVTTISLADDDITMSSLSPAPTPTSQSHILSGSAPKFALHPQVRYSGELRPVTAGAAPPSFSSHSQSSSLSRPRSQSRPYSSHHTQSNSFARPQSTSYPQPPLPSKPQSHTQVRPSTPPQQPSSPQNLSPQASSTTTTPTRLTKAPRAQTKQGRPRARSNPLFTRQTNGSQLTLGLSGRPQSRFKFWTSVSADPSNRNSWLEGQKRKARQRTYMCWSFWLVLAIVVAGVVAAIVVLKHKHII
ncbi:unnamed protein product [Periconia digitata]|uniref:Uncharacterized protein n=1 Tax=Periconia digitata TaxID=1303443 RepID=A0A9W4UKU3_9PLEO|nr:unnamed protein product [Periconia digitata]